MLELQASHVDHLDLRHREASETLGEAHVAVASLLGEMVGLDAWSSTADQGFGSVAPCQHECQASGMIAWGRVLLFV